MRFLLLYSDAYEARTKSWPRAGSVLEVEDLSELVGLHARFGGSRLIVSPSCNVQDYAPYWLEGMEAGFLDETDIEHNHAVTELSAGWRDLPIIEVYNGRRE